MKYEALASVTLIMAMITFMHAFTSHRSAWVSRIAALLLITGLIASTVSGGSDGIGDSGFDFWVVVVGILGFAGLSVASLLIAVYDFFFSGKVSPK